MMKLWNVLAVSALALPSVVVAQDDAPPAAGDPAHEHAAPSGEAAGGERAMGAMQEHMREMQGQMARIHATEDSGERQRLMHEHTRSMQQHMRMMGSMRGEQQTASASRCAEGDARCLMDEMRAENGMMRQRVRMMEDRLGSMQQLMQQMMEHQRVGEAQEADGGR